MEFLAKRKANLNNTAAVDGLTPLMRAAEQGHLALVQFFVRLGANAGLRTDNMEFNGETAIFKAAKARRTAIVAELMASHVDRDCKASERASCCALLRACCVLGCVLATTALPVLGRELWVAARAGAGGWGWCRCR